MDAVPGYAAVSTSVDQARRRAGPKPAGLVNAVLRAVGRAGDGPERFPSPEADPATFLSSWGSHPLWLVERWLGRWGVAQVRSLVESNNRRPPLSLYALDLTPEEAVELLAAASIPAKPAGSGSACVLVAEGVSPADALAAVPGSIVQDPAANLVVLYSDVPRGTDVADLCAAPGGKALASADRARFTLASDRSESRMRMVRDNALRVGREMAFAVADARLPPLAAAGVVLLDVPCTGTGTLARHPDARWRIRPESIETMAALQAEMLAAAADVVTPGGLLIYSTCSLEPEENEERVHELLRARSEFRLEPTDAVASSLLDAEGFLSVTPQDAGFDGAFAARLRKAA